MVEILKRGELPSERVHTCTCTNCKSVLRFQEKEGRWSSNYQADRSCLVIECPVCSQKVYHYPDGGYR